MNNRNIRIRDFHRQKISNPFFVKRRPGRFKKLLGSLGLVALIFGIVYGVFYSPLLRVSRIDVIGNEKIDAALVKASVSKALAGYEYFVLAKDHVFFINSNTIVNGLLIDFAAIRTASIEKKFNRLVVNIEERKETYRLIIGDKSYLLDQEGIGMREAAEGEGDALIALSDDSRTFVEGASLVPAGWTQTIQEIHKYFATHTGIKDRLIRLNAVSNSLEVVTAEGWYAIIDPSADIAKQLESLTSAVLGKFTPAEREQLEYIDIRFGEKLFYKHK